MSSPVTNRIAALPTFAGLDTYAVLQRERRGASIQVDESYFRGQLMAMEAIESIDFTKRQKIALQSHNLHEDIHIDFDSATEDALDEASAKFRQILQQMPELHYLKQNFPGRCFIVPEWLRTRREIKYGARIYFLREDSGPDPDEIIQRNIEAVVNHEQSEFEQFKGRLHGYPDCCIDYFSSYPRDGDSAPELEAIEPLTDFIDTDAIQNSSKEITSIDAIAGGLFETPDAYAFFAREFFPEPGCSRARRQGLSIYEVLCDRYPEKLVKDFFRISAAWSYRMALVTANRSDDSARPVPGSLGREHLISYLPLSAVETYSLYERN